MNKKGFSLSELLVVIAIIAIITVIAVPSIITINRNINKRMYKEKVEKIVSAAELYATNNPDIFNGKEEATIKVRDLLNSDYLSQDVAKDGNTCDDNNASGCVINPMNKESLNDKDVILRKKAVGVVAEFEGETTTIDIEGNTLVEKVCDSFKQGVLTGKYGTNDSETCKCAYDSEGKVTGIYKTDATGAVTNEKVQACIIAGSDPNNWLKYDGVEWRVLGLYDIHNDGTRLSAKMITHQTVDVQ